MAHQVMQRTVQEAGRSKALGVSQLSQDAQEGVHRIAVQHSLLPAWHAGNQKDGTPHGAAQGLHAPGAASTRGNGGVMAAEACYTKQVPMHDQPASSPFRAVLQLAG